MLKSHKQTVLERFNNLNLHDQDFLSCKINPPRTGKNATSICFEFQDSMSKVSVLTFRDCANIRYVMDFDVLASNWFAQTKQVKANCDAKKMKKFIESQMRHWHVRYMPPSSVHEPVKRKLRTIKRYTLFKIYFFGGVVEILARSFVISKKKKIHKGAL